MLIGPFRSVVAHQENSVHIHLPLDMDLRAVQLQTVIERIDKEVIDGSIQALCSIVFECESNELLIEESELILLTISFGLVFIPLRFIQPRQLI